MFVFLLHSPYWGPY